jgi:hypothetical protein
MRNESRILQGLENPVRILRGSNKGRIGSVVFRPDSGHSVLVSIYDELGMPAGELVCKEGVDFEPITQKST